MKRNPLLPLLVAGWVAIALPAALAETPAEELDRLRAEIGELEIRLSNPAQSSQQTMLRQSLRDKVRRMGEVQQQVRFGATAADPGSGSATPSAPSPPARKEAPAVAPRESTPMPRATLPPPRPVEKPAPEAPRAVVPPPSRPSPARASPSPLPEVAVPGAAPLTIYTAQELAIGPGTMSNLDEVARLLRTKSQDEARREWNAYVAGERDLFEAQPTRLRALIHFVARRAYVEPDEELSIAAAQVDTARERKDAVAVARAQDEFSSHLRARPDVADQARRAMMLLQEVADRVMRPSR